MANDDIYDAILNEERDTQKSSLQQSMFAAQNVEPDRQAQVLKLAQTTNIPAPVIDRNFDSVQKRQQESAFDYDSLIDKSPHLATWMQNPENASLAKDDTQSLQALEGHLNDYTYGQKIWQALNSGVSNFSSGVAAVPAYAFDAATFNYNAQVAKSKRDANVRDAYGDYMMDVDAFGNVIDNTFAPTEFIKTPDALANNVIKQAYDAESQMYQERVPELGQSVLGVANLPALDKNFWDNLSKTNIKEAAKVAVLQLVANAPQQAMLLLTGAKFGQVAGLAYAGATTAASKASENRDAGIDPVTGTMGAAVTGGVEAGFENLGTLGLFKNWEHAIMKVGGKQLTREVFKDMGKTLAYSMAGEGFEEAATSVAQDTVDYATGLNPEFSPGKMAENAFNAGLIGGLSGVTMTAPGGVLSGLERQGSVANAKMLKNFYLSFGESAMATKLRERLPERQRELVENMTRDSAVENVYVSPEAVEKHFNQDGKSAVQVLNEMGFGQQYEQAKDTGLDLRIPLSQWVDKVGGTPAFTAIADEVKFSPDQKSVGEHQAERQAEVAKAEEAKRIADEQIEADAEVAEVDAHNENVSSLIQTISDQLVATGRYSEQTVKQYAPLIEERLKRRASIRGESAADVFARQNLSIERTDQIAGGDGLNQSDRSFQNQIPMPMQVGVVRSDGLVGTVEDVRASAQIKYEGQSYVNAHTGWTIEMPNNGIKKAWKTLATEANRLAMSNLDGLIENAVYARTEADKDGHSQSVDIYYAPMSSPTKDYLVRLVVRNSEGKKFYDKFAIEKESNRPPVRDKYGSEAVSEVTNESVDDQSTLDQTKTTVGDASTTTPENATRTSTIPIDQFIADVKNAQRSDPYFQDARGQIQLGSGSVKILLGPNTDRSTFLHETGHLWLSEMGEDVGHLTKLDPESLSAEQRQFLKDSDTVLEWLGASSWEKITTEQHEQWARGSEAYFMEGKAPSERLTQAFDRFRQWLTGIYRSIKGLDVELNDDVRSVFDRLLATETAIAEAKSKLERPVLFNDPRRMGLSEAKTYEYLNAQALAEAESKQALDEKLIKELKRTQTKSYNEQRSKVEEQVRAEVAKTPDQIAKSVLQRGVMPDGSALPEGMGAIKLSKKAIVEEFGEARLKKLPKPFVYARDGGVNPATAAEMFGFRNADALLTSLETSGKFSDVVSEQTDARMKAEYGDLQTDGRMPDEALKSIHNEKRSQLLHKELEILMRESLPVFKDVVRRVSQPIPKIEAIRLQAEGLIAARQIREIKPIEFERAQAKYAKQAVNLMLKGDFDGAFDAKTKELLNHELHRSGTEAIEIADKTVEYMKKFRKESKRQQLGRTDYLEQIDSILSRFQFGRVTDKELNRREKTLSEWIAQKEASGESSGEEVYAADFLKDERVSKNYKQLTYEEMLGVRDLVKQIEHMAIQSDKLLSFDKAVRREDVKNELVAAIRANLKKKAPRPFTKEGETTRYRFGKTVEQFDSSMIKMEQVIHWMDGGDIEGPWHEYLWHRVADAQTAEYDYTAEVTAKIAKLVMGMPKELRSTMSDQVEIPGIERKMVRRDLIGVALNVGNEGNYQKLLDGHGWSEDTVRFMLDKLTESEWNFVQGTWTTLKEMWPDISKLQKDLTGIEPDQIAIRPITTKFGTLEGGYYPLMYDSIASEQGALQLSTRAGGLVEDSYTRAPTPKGHTKSRVQGFSAPIDLDLDNLPSHIAGVVKDLTHRKWLIDANFIVNNREIRGAIADHLGEAYVPMFQDWVKQIVNDRNSASTKSLSVWRRMVDATRFNATVAAMGFKATTLLAQFGDFAVAIENVGGKELDGHTYMLKGMSKFLSHPMRTFQEVTVKSGEMRHRFETKDRELRDKLRQIEGREDLVSKIQETALHGIGYVEMSIALPTWQAGYEKAIAQGLSEDFAIRSGDKAVRLSFGSAGAKDLAGVMSRNDTFMRVMTMFYTPFSALYARLRTIGHDVEGVKSIPQLAARTFLVWTVAATMGELVAGKGPSGEADEEEWLNWWLKTQALYPFMAVPMLRDVVSGVFSDYGYTFSPLAQAGKTTVEAIKTAKQVMDGDKDLADLGKKTLKASGFWLGLPAGQIDITGSYLMDLYNGDEDPENLGEFAHHMIMRREKE